MRSASFAYGCALGALVSSALAGASCTGVSEADILFGGPPGAGGSTGAGASTTSSSTAATTSSSHAASSSGQATTSSSGSHTSSASSSSSGSHESSASSSGGPPPVACNNGTCKSGQICCHNAADLGGDHCGSAGQCGTGFIEIDCSSPTDCPTGQICCAHYSKVGGMIEYTSIACYPSCGPAGSTYVICTGNPGECPPGTTCQPTSVLGNGYEICSN